MIAVDTNVLVRLFVADEPAQASNVSGAQEPRLFGGEDAAAVFGFVTACASDVMSTSFG